MEWPDPGGGADRRVNRDALLSVRDLEVAFPLSAWLGATSVPVVCGVSFDVGRGETLGIVGESGCGKTTLARALLRLIEPVGGSIFFDGQDLGRASSAALRRLRRDLQMVFQDPLGSLNPRMRVADIVGEPLRVQRQGPGRRRRARVAELLDRVGLGAQSAARFPHELSGGQRQRIGIARALACGPKLVVLDEPVSALDVSLRGQILNLLADLRDEFSLSYLLIAHDLMVVRQFCHRVAVMYSGEIVEVGPSVEVFAGPRHPFTRSLVSSILEATPGRAARVEDQSTRELGAVEPPSPVRRPPGCAFHPRCSEASERCRAEAPALAACDALAPSRRVACHHPLVPPPPRA